MNNMQPVSSFGMARGALFINSAHYALCIKKYDYPEPDCIGVEIYLMVLMSIV